jgi:CheY-like chemotaxis protein
MMPVMDGPSFLRERQALPWLAAIPVLVLTAHPYHHRELDGLAPTAALRKPYDVDDLIAAVEALRDGETGRSEAC